MMRESDRITRHLDEDEFGAVIFAPARDPDLASRVSSHIARCEACASKLESLRAADRDAGNWLTLLDVPTPSVDRREILRAAKRTSGRGVATPYRRVAAIVAFTVVAAGVAAAFPNSPLRGLITRARISLGFPAPKTATPSATGPAAAVSPALLFVPGSSLELVFAREGTAGTIHVRMTDGDQVSLSSSDNGSRYQVSSGRIDVEQSPMGGNFELALPKSLPEVRILIGGRLAFERAVGTPPPPSEFTIPLALPDRASRLH